jgi:hypothetical protein
MKWIAMRLLLAVALIGAGWTIGRTQTSLPDFELRIDAPEGGTSIECVRGCELAWVERMEPSVTKPEETFTMKCGGTRDGRCRSGRVGGWIRR